MNVVVGSYEIGDEGGRRLEDRLQGVEVALDALYERVGSLEVDTSEHGESIRQLGLEFTTMRDTLRDTLRRMNRQRCFDISRWVITTLLVMGFLYGFDRLSRNVKA